MSYFGYTEDQFYKISGIGMFQFDLDLYAVTAYSDRYEKEVNDPWHSATNSFDLLTPEESVKHYGEKLVKEWMEKAELYIEVNQLSSIQRQRQQQRQQPQFDREQPSGQQTCIDDQQTCADAQQCCADDQQIDDEQFDLCSYFGQYQTDIELYMVSLWSEKFGREVNNPWYDADKKKYLTSYEEGIQLYGEELVKEWVKKASLYLRKYSMKKH
ncbi:MAG: hypothetical protein IJQ24_02715 [Synergistaceae bacterium]|nr:hypothetical protein [Synergistaceae bacterium]